MAGAAGAIRAGAAYIELVANDNQFYRALGRAEREFKRFSGRMAAAAKAAGGLVGGLGSGLTRAGGGLFAGGVATLSPLVKAVDTVRDLAKMDDVAKALGISAREATGLFGVFAEGGSDVRDATEGMITFNDRVTEALEGRGEVAPKLFADMGVSAEAFKGLNTFDRMLLLQKTLSGLPDKAKAAGLLLKAVGEDTGKNMLRTLSMSPDQFRRRIGQLSTGQGSLTIAKAAETAYLSAASSISAAWRQMVVAVAPALVALAGHVGGIADRVKAFAAENPQVVPSVLALGAAAAAAGAALLVAGPALSAVVGGLAGLASLAGSAGGLVTGLAGGFSVLARAAAAAGQLVAGPAVAGLARWLGAGLGGMAQAAYGFLAGLVGRLGAAAGFLGRFAAVAGRAFAAVGGAVSAVATGPVLSGIATGLGALVSVAVVRADLFRGAWDGAAETLSKLAETASQTWAGVRDAIKGNDFQLAFDVAVAGLTVAWRQAVYDLTAAWLTFVHRVKNDIKTQVKREATGFLTDAALALAPGSQLVNKDATDAVVDDAFRRNEIARARLDADLAGEAAALDAAKRSLAALTGRAAVSPLAPAATDLAAAAAAEARFAAAAEDFQFDLFGTNRLSAVADAVAPLRDVLTGAVRQSSAALVQSGTFAFGDGRREEKDIAKRQLEEQKKINKNLEKKDGLVFAA